jgi:hypothetical protein
VLWLVGIKLRPQGLEDGDAITLAEPNSLDGDGGATATARRRLRKSDHQSNLILSDI